MKIKGNFPLNFQSNLLKNIFRSLRHVLTNNNKRPSNNIISYPHKKSAPHDALNQFNQFNQFNSIYLSKLL